VSALLWVKGPILAVTPVVGFINCSRSKLVWGATLERKNGDEKFSPRNS